MDMVALFLVVFAASLVGNVVSDLLSRKLFK